MNALHDFNLHYTFPVILNLQFIMNFVRVCILDEISSSVICPTTRYLASRYICGCSSVFGFPELSSQHHQPIPLTSAPQTAPNNHPDKAWRTFGHNLVRFLPYNNSSWGTQVVKLQKGIIKLVHTTCVLFLVFCSHIITL